ncbi:uncharacterized protein LOC143043476 [Mytilus galloprovincialis]|uniref:uncharacterized protein LOC143043476 n=1 Tax=Mytilus galloprovincialis TaxID=29158 RepID=UPI003F7B9CC8
MFIKEETSKLQEENAELKDNLKNLSKQLKEYENRVVLSKEETSKLQKDNAELKDNLQNLSKQLKESENRVVFSKEETSKFKEENAELKDNLKNLSRQIKESENRVMVSKAETSKLLKDNAELKDNLQNVSKQLKDSESRLSEEGNDPTLEQIGKGSIIRAQTMINYDLLLAEKSEEVTKKVSELYEDKWEVAMIELGENGGKEKNIEFLLKILKNAYSFCECLEGRLTDGFEQAMVNAAANIKEVVDTTVFVRPILERLERCIIQLFFRQYSQYQEYRTKEPVYSYITEALSLSWFLVTRNPRVSISTTIPDESHLQFYDTYSTDGSEVDYVVLPMITWSTNKREIIRKGIAAFK